MVCLFWPQVRSIGKRDCGNLFKLGDDMIQFGGLHALLAASVADMLPVNVSFHDISKLCWCRGKEKQSHVLPDYPPRPSLHLCLPWPALACAGGLVQ